MAFSDECFAGTLGVKNPFSYFSTKTYDVGTQKNCLWEAMRAQWFSGRVLDSSLTNVTALCPIARHMNPCLVLAQPKKTRPDIAEKLLTGT